MKTKLPYARTVRHKTGASDICADFGKGNEDSVRA